MMRRSGLPWILTTLLLVLAAFLLWRPVHAQSLPTRLVQAGDLVHESSFKVANSGECFNYVQGTIAFNPVRDSLFLVGHDQQQQVAEISMTGAVVQACRSVVNLSAVGDSNLRIGGLHVIGDKLVVAVYRYYDGDASAEVSHFVRSVTLTSTSVQGPFRVGSLAPAFTAGYFAPIPQAWQSVLGGDLLNGQCCLSIISRTSYGPSVSSVRSSDLLQARNPTPASVLVGYTQPNPLEPYGASGVHVLFNGTTRMHGVLFPEGTASVLFFGINGVGNYCYGEAAACGDPSNNSKGEHAYPYQNQVWAYNANDLVAVRAGSKQMWQARPYATWKLDGITGDLVGVTTDPATGRIFVAEDLGQNAQGLPLGTRIHIYRLSGTVTPPPPPPPPPTTTTVPPTPIDQVVGPWGPWAAAGEWSACEGGTQTRAEMRTRQELSPAQNGGATYPLSETRTASQPCATEPPPPPPPPQAGLTDSGTVVSVTPQTERVCVARTWFWCSRYEDQPTGAWEAVIDLALFGRLMHTFDSAPPFTAGDRVTVTIVGQ